MLAGTRVSLHCELGPAHPPPSAILWLRNDRHQASTTGPIFSFTAEPTRASTYRCVGQNVAGFTQSPPLAVIVWCEWWFQDTPPVNTGLPVGLCALCVSCLLGAVLPPSGGFETLKLPFWVLPTPWEGFKPCHGSFETPPPSSSPK